MEMMVSFWICMANGKKHPFDENRKCLGMVTTSINYASRMDEDVITRVTVNGNTAEVEYECGRAFDENGDAQKGRVKLTFNPQTKAVTIKMLQTPERYWRMLLYL